MSDDDIEKLVGRVDHDNSGEARRYLFQAISSVEIFFPYKVEKRDGKETKSTPLARLSNGTHAMMLFTSKSHPHLLEHQQFAGGTFKDALTAATKITSLDWVILWNRASQRAVIAKDEISDILDDINSHSTDHRSYTAARENDKAREMLEKLISSAVADNTDSLPMTIGSAIGDREVFLELSGGNDPDGQPEMKTFQIEHLSHVIRAYTSRMRPGIRYGGIRWQALKEMIRTVTEIGGVQIMNDADDWLVFDREALGLNPGDK